ncbi:hypothetical protein [Parendozoicomonas haliclonae]|uniref:Uncharacterized protein n=1 Tax=Parendozoicomonas haliclonae TaxID=1960125 RepID=A0A1X7AMJ2_9GAMM|nr:hypothetical protein [Parendozoicomonas haliclonae]SMA49148.1 hypothetical protein EHSB41UT_03084 [Parendozoicomonas haliclonae]
MNRSQALLFSSVFALAAHSHGESAMAELINNIPPQGIWAHNFTTLLRSAEPDQWGNWNLDTSITPGAVGYIDTNSGEFVRLAVMPGTTSTTTPLSASIKLSTDYVTSRQFNVNLDDDIPVHITPGATVTPNIGLTAEWEFKRSGSLAVQWATESQEQIDNPVTTMTQNLTWLESEAGKVGMYDSEYGIQQGFGMVTGVVWARSGMNAGSLSDSSTLSFTGKVNGIESMFGLDGANSNNSAAFSSMSTDGALNTYSWPATSNTTTSTLIPIAYSFASASGTTIIPSWIGTVNAFEIVLNNTHSSYIVEADLEYVTTEGKTVTSSTSVTGGLSTSLSDIPLDATNLSLKLRFVGTIHSSYYTMHWEKPLGHWLTGQRHIDLYGIWPGPTSYKILEEDNLQK